MVNFEGRDHPFTEFGLGIHVLQPGQPNGKYHAEAVQEDFLVLSGECVCLIEGEERRLKAWTSSTAAGDAPHLRRRATGLARSSWPAPGARAGRSTTPDELARRYGASAPEATDAPPEAYRDWTRTFEPVRGDWPPST